MPMKTFFTALAVMWLTTASTAFAAAETAAKPAADPARRCVMCHKKEPAKMQGIHAQAVNPHDNTAVNCTNCHAPVDPNGTAHPKNRKNITSYPPLFPGMNEAAPVTTEAASDAADTAAPQTAEPSEPLAVSQNALCMNCHTPEVLREAFWPHDVHAAQLSCSDCHKLHPVTDPMKEISEAQKTSMCLDCHATTPVKTEDTQ